MEQAAHAALEQGRKNAEMLTALMAKLDGTLSPSSTGDGVSASPTDSGSSASAPTDEQAGIASVPTRIRRKTA